MPIITPFIAARRFASTIGAGTGTGVIFAIAATAFNNDAGTAATAFPGSYAYYKRMVLSLLRTQGAPRLIKLQGHGKYNYIIFQRDNPTAVAAEIRKRIKTAEREKERTEAAL